MPPFPPIWKYGAFKLRLSKLLRFHQSPSQRMCLKSAIQRMSGLNDPPFRVKTREAYYVSDQGHSQGQGERAPTQKPSPPPWGPLMKLCFIKRSMENCHFGSRSAPSPSCCPSSWKVLLCPWSWWRWWSWSYSWWKHCKVVEIYTYKWCDGSNFPKTFF